MPGEKVCVSYYSKLFMATVKALLPENRCIVSRYSDNCEMTIDCNKCQKADKVSEMDREEKLKLIKQITPSISIKTINEICDYSIYRRSVDMIGFSELLKDYIVQQKRECIAYLVDEYEMELRNTRSRSYQ